MWSRLAPFVRRRDAKLIGRYFKNCLAFYFSRKQLVSSPWQLRGDEKQFDGQQRYQSYMSGIYRQAGK